MAETNLKPLVGQRVKALKENVRLSYVNIIDSLEKQKKMMDLLDLDTKPIDGMIKYFNKHLNYVPKE